MTQFLLHNATLVDPASGRSARGSLLVRDGMIAQIGWGETLAAPDAHAIDCGGDIVCPGLIDMRAFLGEPGAEHRETIRSATRAAAAGGITTIVAMPGTTPPIDDPAVVDFLQRRARDTGLVRVLAAAALTRALAGREIAEIGLLQAAGAVAFTDGLHSVADAQVMRRAMSWARDFDALVMPFTEDRALAGSGVMNEGEFASRLGLPGNPREAETIMLERDMRLVALTGARYHAALITCAASLEVIARAKAAGLPVTCGVSINHLALNETDIGDYRTFLKLAPPLRGEEDRMALVAALAVGLIDVIVSDHDPQDVETKRLPFAEAAPGAIGLETLLAVGLRLVNADEMSMAALLRAFTTRPAEILRLPQGRLAVGAPADLIRFDPDEPFVVDRDTLMSRSKNSPFDEARLQGRVKLTMVAGEIVHA